MCLEGLKKFDVKLDKNGIGIGYKVFDVNSRGGLFCPFFANAKKRPLNKWMKSRPMLLSGRSQFYTDELFFSYMAGFHIFKTKEGATIYKAYNYWQTIKQVKFRGVLATGMWASRECIVAKEMMISEDK